MGAKALGNTTLSKYCQRRNKDIDVKRATQEDYIKYRLDRAWKTLEDAKYLASVKVGTHPLIGYTMHVLFCTRIIFKIPNY